MDDNNYYNSLDSTDTPTSEDETTSAPIDEVKTPLEADEVQDDSSNDTPTEDSYVVQLYEFYRSQPRRATSVTLVNKKTTALFVVFILVCLGILIGCMAIDFNNPQAYTSAETIGSEVTEDEDSTEYDFSTNDSIDIKQYDTPQREDSTYTNTDGSYTVAGVAKYSSSSIIAIYVSTDGINLTGMGSGIVFSEDGYVLTNAHVIEDANYIIGVIDDETEFNLSFVGMDTDLDIAVLQADRTDLPVATMGNSDSVILGEDVVAIGNPAGLTGTVTKGIVSSISRAYTTSDNVERTYIQTDTAISPGNSGGALLNMYGQVVGITTLKISEDETYEGLGFAIRINDALECAESLIQNRFRIGITFNLKSNEIEITDIDKTCSVASTDLQSGDIITQINGEEVNDYSSVMSALEGFKPGDKVTAKVERRSSDGLKNEFYIEFRLMPYNS
jgi:serine protease Do